LGKRTLVVLVAAALVATGGAYFLRAAPPGFDGGPTLDEMAGDIGTPIMRNLYRGHVPGRSGEIVLVPKPHRYIVNDWDLRTLGSSSPDTFVSHPNPWAYLARVPLILYGPGYVPEGVRRADEVDVTGLARTYAGLLGFEGPRAVPHRSHPRQPRDRYLPEKTRDPKQSGLERREPAGPHGLRPVGREER
jgi:hypothetical protein